MKILVIDNQNPANSPRTIQTIKALNTDFQIVLAGNTKVTSEHLDQFIDLQKVISPYRDKVQRHFNRPWLIRKLYSFYTRFIINGELKRANQFSNRFLGGGHRLIQDALIDLDIDLIINHHVDTLPLAINLGIKKDIPVILNAHEYYLEQHAHDPEWMRNYQDQIKWIFAQYLHRTSTIFTVGEQIKNLYAQWTSCPIEVIRNDRSYLELQPTESFDDKIRLVHHGNAFEARKIEDMIEVMSFLPAQYSLTFYLVNGKSSYMDKLKSLAAGRNIYFKDPVAREDLPYELNKYDIGIHMLPPVNTNHLLALPNKFFDFIQARLCIVTGPSPEMANLIKEYSIGKSSKEFTPRSVANTILNISTAELKGFKARTNKAALELNSQTTQQQISQIVNNLLQMNNLEGQD